MTPQEQAALELALTQKINQTQLQEKDPDAEKLLGHELGANPDALYILAQTVLVQNIALDQAKAQVAQLQQQLQQARQQPAHTTSFLGRLLGDRDPSRLRHPLRPTSRFSSTRPRSRIQYGPPQPQYPPQQQYVPVQSGQPSFLRGAMQTAAGVAAGALAFEGVESILHGFGHWPDPAMGMGGMGMGSDMGMGGGFERPVEETVVNNYYDQPGGRSTTTRAALSSRMPAATRPIRTTRGDSTIPATPPASTTTTQVTLQALMAEAATTEEAVSTMGAEADLMTVAEAEIAAETWSSSLHRTQVSEARPGAPNWGFRFCTPAAQGCEAGFCLPQLNRLPIITFAIQ